MKFEDIQYVNDQKTLNIKFANKIPVQKKQLILFNKTSKNYYIKVEEQGNLVNYQLDVDVNTEEIIDKVLEKKLNYTARLENVETITMVSFNTPQLNMNFPFLLEDQFIRGKKIEILKKMLIDKYVVSKLENKKSVILGFKLEKDIEEYILLGKETFLILEKVKKDFYIKEKTIEGEETYSKMEEEVFSIKQEKKIKSRDFKIKDYQIFMINGEINFYDNSENFRMTTLDKITMTEIKNNPNSYLNLWNTYADFERELSLKKVKDKGYFKIINMKPLKEGQKKLIELELDRAIEIEEEETLRVVSKDPKDLFSEYTLEKEQEFFKNGDYDCDVVVTKSKLKNRTRITVYYEEKINEKDAKFLFLSLKGNDAVFKRRERARELISRNQAGIENLNQLIEGKIPYKKIKEKKRHKALSFQTKQSLFPKYDPTENQQEAIEIALNTPDIALIQGPPGTGKTTVITGILQRLSEIKKGVGNISGKNLLTSFQHDAVTNAIERVKILGLPSEKYGQKNKEDGKVLNNVFRKYIYETLNKLYEDNPQLKEMVEEKELFELYLTYSNLEFSPEKNQIRTLLKALKKFLITYGFVSEIDKIKELERELEYINKDYSFINKDSIRKLPITQKMLEDNGRYFIEKTVDILEKAVVSQEIPDNFKKEIQFLKHCLESNELNFKRIRRCKNMIISKLTPVEDIFLTSGENKKIDNIFMEINSSIEKIKKESKDHKERLKIKFIDELENNPLRVRDTLRSYITTFAATCQQTQGKAIKEAKNKGEKIKAAKNFELEEYEKYENVIVDEAARSNPPDLLIPMAAATERIVLVGDHKQLPHLIDDEILNYMDNIIEDENMSVKEATSKSGVLKTSMFEILEEKCKELEKVDGIKRTIMLDKQYRMHPTMGSFISKHFYEGKLENGIDNPDKFKTKLKNLEGLALAWYDLPYSEEFREEKRNNSSLRTIEAKEIAKFLYKNIDSEEAKGKNFGVITFYAEQVKEILKELANPENREDDTQRPIVIQDKDGYKIADYYAFSKEDGINEKIRIGSVDSFQGMEFNYVCLSMVRSNNLPLKTEKDIRRKFGFLTNPNRLCVSMSRQKELIIMFGDSQMLKGKEFEDIAVLQDYLGICKGGNAYGKYKLILP